MSLWWWDGALGLSHSTSTEGLAVGVRRAPFATLQPGDGLSKSLPRAGAGAGRVVRMRGPRVHELMNMHEASPAHAGRRGNSSEASACESLWPGSQNSAARKLHVFVLKPRGFK